MRNPDVVAIRAAVEALGLAPLDAVESIDDAAGLLAEIDDLRQALAVIRDEVVAFLVDTVPGKEYVVEGQPNVLKVEVKTAVKRTKWQSKELLPRVLSRALDERVIDEETGEALESDAEVIGRILAECVVPAWKVTGLRAIGLNPDDYCLEEWGARTIKLTRP